MYWNVLKNHLKNKTVETKIYDNIIFFFLQASGKANGQKMALCQPCQPKQYEEEEKNNKVGTLCTLSRKQKKLKKSWKPDSAVAFLLIG